jgi:hypothetical protein
MGQILACLVAEMNAIEETMETKMDVNQEKMDAWLNEIKAWRKETTAC